jgi:AcrR family transcriptional regulator
MIEARIVAVRMDRRPRMRLSPTDRRRSILAAAAKTFATTSYNEVSVARIARRAGASEALVYHYFPSKAALYVALVERAIDTLLDRQQAALSTLEPRASIRARLGLSVEVYLDFIAERPVGWSTLVAERNAEPAEAVALRQQARNNYLGLLGELLSEGGRPADEYTLTGYLAFLDAACALWVSKGAPPADRAGIVAQTLGALDGAMATAADRRG